MTIFNLGSINIDHVYRLAHLPRPGETVACAGYSRGLGGKGANQSLAAALAGARVHHIGAVGADGGWAVERLAAAGVDIDAIATVAGPTGHAIIQVDAAAENQIVTHAGANRSLDMAQVEAALARARPGDWFLTQNETALAPEALKLAKERGLKTAYAAAPFEAAAAAAVIDHVDLIAMNKVEADQLSRHLGVDPARLPVGETLVTLGAMGARLMRRRSNSQTAAAAFKVKAVDTTGAGDCFLGNFLAARERGLDGAEALRHASAAAAIQVTRPGAAEAMPTAAEVAAFLAERVG